MLENKGLYQQLEEGVENMKLEKVMQLSDNSYPIHLCFVCVKNNRRKLSGRRQKELRQRGERERKVYNYTDVLTSVNNILMSVITYNQEINLILGEKHHTF